MDAGDWPLELLLDELSLHVRRRLQRALVDSGAGLARARKQELLLGCRERGLLLAGTLLRPIVGEADFAYLNSESAFGVAHHQLRAGLPLILAFGYELTAGLHARRRGAAARRDELAALGALFNGGIVIFDRTCDNLKDGAADLGRLFGAATMERLAGDAAGAGALSALAAAQPRPELRILLQLVSAFYARARAAAAGDDAAWQRINRLLLAAYRAEIGSTRQGELDRAQVAAAAEAKSVLPFRVLAALAALDGAALPEGDGDGAGDFVGELATVFWLLDDLVDLVRDLRTGSANSIACLAPAGPTAARAAALLDGPFVGASVQRLQHSLHQVAQLLADDAPLRDLVFAYVGGWSD